jgi:hypothetical protein
LEKERKDNGFWNDGVLTKPQFDTIINVLEI